MRPKKVVQRKILCSIFFSKKAKKNFYFSFLAQLQLFWLSPFFLWLGKKLIGQKHFKRHFFNVSDDFDQKTKNVNRNFFANLNQKFLPGDFENHFWVWSSFEARRDGLIDPPHLTVSTSYPGIENILSICFVSFFL